MAQALPEPEWHESASTCPACGYSLEGIDRGKPCPECGLPDCGRQVIVCGVPNVRSVMRGWRTLAIVLLCVCAMLGPQIWVMVSLYFSPWIAVAILAATAVGAVLLIATAPRGQAGRSRFIFASGGIGVMPLKSTPSDVVPATGFIRFRGDEAVEIQHISSVWAKVRIHRPDQVVFQAGVRCSRADSDRLRESITLLVRAAADGRLS